MSIGTLPSDSECFETEAIATDRHRTVFEVLATAPSLCWNATHSCHAELVASVLTERDDPDGGSYFDGDEVEECMRAPRARRANAAGRATSGISRDRPTAATGDGPGRRNRGPVLSMSMCPVTAGQA